MDEKKDFYKTFEILRKHCSNKLYLKKSDSGDIIIRSDIKDSREVEAFVQAYETVSHSRFNVFRSNKSSSKFLYSKIWICHRRAFRKKVGKYGSCRAKIYVLIKINTKNTRYRDSFMKMKPPFAAVIRIWPEHNHSVMDRQTLKGLKLSNGIKECFYEYFNNGIVGLYAKRLHEQNLRKANFSSLDDASMNPRMNYIYKLQKKWKESVEETKSKEVFEPKDFKSVQESKADNKSVQESKANAKSVQELKADAKSVQELKDDEDDADEDKSLNNIKNNCGFLNVKEVVSKLEYDSDVEDCVMEKIADDIIEDLERGDIKEDPPPVKTDNSMLTTLPIIINIPTFFLNCDFGVQNVTVNKIANISSSSINLQNYNEIPNAFISQTTNRNVSSSSIDIQNYDSVIQNVVNTELTDSNVTSSSIKIHSYGSVVQNIIKNDVTDPNISLPLVSPQSENNVIVNSIVKQEIMDENVSSSISIKESSGIQNAVVKQEMAEGNIGSSLTSMQIYSTEVQHPTVKQEITNMNVSSPPLRIQNYGCVLQRAVKNKNVNFYGKVPIQPKLPPKHQVVIYDVTTNAYKTFTISTTTPSGANKLSNFVRHK